jgi:hypothetical protein
VPEPADDTLPVLASVPPPLFHCDIGSCAFTSSTAQGLGMHRFHSHGIRGKSAPTTKQKSAPTPKVPRDVKSDDIVNVVLSQLFPRGIPVSKVRAVMAWARHTDDFMDDLRG